MEIVLFVFLFLLLIWNIIISFILYKTLMANFEIQDINQAYKDFMTQLYDTLVYDTAFLKSNLVQRFSLDIPEVADLHKKFSEFEKKINTSRLLLQQTKLLDPDAGGPGP